MKSKYNVLTSDHGGYRRGNIFNFPLCLFSMAHYNSITTSIATIIKSYLPLWSIRMSNWVVFYLSLYVPNLAGFLSHGFCSRIFSESKYLTNWNSMFNSGLPSNTSFSIFSYTFCFPGCFSKIENFLDIYMYMGCGQS